MANYIRCLLLIPQLGCNVFAKYHFSLRPDNISQVKKGDSVSKIRLFGVVAATLICLGLFAARVLTLGNLKYREMNWNLTLAWVPLALSLLFARAISGKWSRSAVVGYLAVWLAFYPNAPYMITDLVFRQHSSVFDYLLIGVYAATGLLLGYTSLQVILKKIGADPWTGSGRLFCLVVLFLSGYALFLGRFLRWNSWDILINPAGLIQSSLERMADGLVFAVLSSCFLIPAFYAFHKVFPEEK